MAVAVVGGTEHQLTKESFEYVQANCKEAMKRGQAEPVAGSITASSPLSKILGGAGPCRTGDVAFTHGFAHADQIAYIVPMGAMIGAHVTPIDHVYVYYPETSERPVGDDRYPVPSPAAGTVVEVSMFASDYRVVIEHSCDLYSVYIHVQRLVGPLASIEGTVSFGKHWSGRIPVQAGEAFATDGGQPGYDYSLFDQKVSLGFANRSSYDRFEQWKPYTADPFERLAEPVRSALLAKNLRRVAPFGGRIDYDQPGTAAGNWFVEGTNGYFGRLQNQTDGPIRPDQQRGYWDTHLALAPDPIDPSFTIVSMGGWDGGRVVQYGVKGNAPAPSEVTAASGVVAYELVSYQYVTASGAPWVSSEPGRNPAFDPGLRARGGDQVHGVLLVQVQADGSLLVEAFPGRRAADVPGFTDAKVRYTH